MMRLKRIFAIVASLASFYGIFGQFNGRLFSNDSMKVFRRDSISIWGNFTNSGNSMSGGGFILEEGANVVMYGDTFKNSNATEIGGGGEILMTRPRPFPYPSATKQIFDGGGILSSIPDLTINNNSTVDILINDLKVRDSVKFVLGKLYLNGHDLYVGNGNPGTITGYDENKYIVTNGILTDTKGFLIRENIGTAEAVFPIGFDATHYEPGSIQQFGTADLIKMRVAEHTKSLGTTGTDQNNRSTQTTWFIEEGTPGGSNATLKLQHQNYHEGYVFAANRQHHFISHYVGYSPNLEGDTVSFSNWDNFKMVSCQPGTSTGTLTSGIPIPNNTVTTRTGVTFFSPFAKTAWTPPSLLSPLPTNFLRVEAKKQAGNQVEIYWIMGNEEKVKSYIIQRKYDYQKSFENIKNVEKKSVTSNQDYSILDSISSNNAEIAYRVIAMDELGKQTVSKVVFVQNDKALLSINTYPNPVSGILQIGFPANITQVSVSVYSSIGELLHKSVGENEVDFSKWSPGTYWLEIIYNGVKETKKIIKI